MIYIAYKYSETQTYSNIVDAEMIHLTTTDEFNH